jgi:hypothetical protein
LALQSFNCQRVPLGLVCFLLRVQFNLAWLRRCQGMVSFSLRKVPSKIGSIWF